MLVRFILSIAHISLRAQLSLTPFETSRPTNVACDEQAEISQYKYYYNVYLPVAVFIMCHRLCQINLFFFIVFNTFSRFYWFFKCITLVIYELFMLIFLLVPVSLIDILFILINI